MGNNKLGTIWRNRAMGNNKWGKGGINGEMKKRSQSLRKKILVAIKLCSRVLQVGKLENFS
jgi:hypothetical protein